LLPIHDSRLLLLLLLHVALLLLQQRWRLLQQLWRSRLLRRPLQLLQLLLLL
jgi:hypothetical protein